MADKTKIEWADATVNAINGCSLASPGCTNCYAMKQAHRFPARQGLTMPSTGRPAVADGEARSRANLNMVWTGEVRLNESALLQPLKWKRPRRIFWNAHGDTFHEKVPDTWIDQVFAVCALTPQHQHLILTKRSARMRDYFSHRAGPDAPFEGHRWGKALDHICKNDVQTKRITADQRMRAILDMTLVVLGTPLPNVWLGVSVEDQRRADQRIPDLLAAPAARRFLSCEPLLGPVFPWTKLLLAKTNKLLNQPWDTNIPGLDWVIVGGESGPHARPMHPDWPRALRDQCQAAGVPFFFKQWGLHLPTGQHNGMGEIWNGRIADGTPEGQPTTMRGTKAITGRLLDGREWNEVPQ